MKNRHFRNNKEASIKAGAVILVAVLIIASVLIFYTVTPTPYWETDVEFGMWQDEIIIEFADGTTESLKVVQETKDRPFAVYYASKEITSISMKLSASVTGTGFEGATIKASGFGYKASIMDGSTVKKTWLDTRDFEINVGMDQTEQLFPPNGYAYGKIVDEINNNPSKYPYERYQIWFEPQGTVQYRGYIAMPLGTSTGYDWVTCTMPPTREPTVVVEHDIITGQIMVTLSDVIIS